MDGSNCKVSLIKRMIGRTIVELSNELGEHFSTPSYRVLVVNFLPKTILVYENWLLVENIV